MRSWIGFWTMGLLTLFLVGCDLGEPVVYVTAAPANLSPVLPDEEVNRPVPITPSPMAPPGPSPTPTPAPASRWLISAAPGVPAALEAAARSLPPPFAWSDTPDGADLLLRVNGAEPLATWIYAAAGPFTTVADSISVADLRARWADGSLLLTESARAAWAAGWEEPAASPTPLAPADLVPELWRRGEPALTLLPFDALTPDLKVMAVDGLSPLDADFAADAYPLRLSIGVDGPPEAVAALRDAWAGPNTNRDPARLTRVAMTGVTALTRATAYQMEIRGIGYPGEAVGPIMRAADIAHVSHEVPFAPDCPYPNPVGGTTFCARDAYLQLLVDIGVDVVELTGNHVNDWGAENLAHSIDLYEAAGMRLFGGGRDLAAAREPALFEHHGNQIAFVGCNPVGPAYAWAADGKPGSNPCDDQALATRIADLRDAGYLVIATLQYQESYHYGATARQQADFRALAAAGAAAVNGSQGHHAQGFDFHQGAFIHYGTGNLFFDQMQMAGTRQTFVDTYVIYDGRLLSVSLWTGLIENYARPRPMSEAERAQLLNQVFAVSDWSP